MKHRFWLHSLNAPSFVVDITQFGTMVKVKARTGNTELAPALRFVNWKEAQQSFRAKVADQEMIEMTRATLGKVGVAVMTVV